MEIQLLNGISPVSTLLYFLNIALMIGGLVLIVWLISTLKNNKATLKRLEEKVDRLNLK